MARKLSLLLVCLFACIYSHAQWINRSAPGDGNISMPTDNIIYTSSSAGIFKLTNGGTSSVFINKTNFTNFTQAQQFIFQTWSTNVHFITENTGFYFGSNGFDTHQVIFRTINGGQTWTLVYQQAIDNGFLGVEPLTKMVFTTATTGYATGGHGVLLKTTDGGATWSKLKTPEIFFYSDLDVVNGRLSLTAGKKIHYTTNDGTSWSTVSITTTSGGIQSLTFFSNNRAALVTSNGLFLSNDNGLTWAPIRKFPVNIGFRKVVTAGSFVYAVTNIGVYKSEDGRFWDLQRSIGNVDLADIDFFDATHGFITSRALSRTGYYTSTGGDEITVNDVNLLEVDYQTSGCRGEYPIPVKFMNNGKATLTSVTFNYTVNNSGPFEYKWNGMLAAGDTSGFVNIALYNFGKTDLEYQVVITASAPNNVTDEDAANNSTSKVYVFPNQKGAYMIGNQAGDDYATLEPALLRLSTYPACDSVSFTIRPGTYVVTTKSIASYADLKVTLKGLTNNPADVVVKMPGEGITFDVSQLKIQGLTIESEGYTSVAVMGTKVVGFNISNNVFRRGPSANLYGEHIQFEALPDQAVIAANTFIGGNVGVRYFLWRAETSPGAITVEDNVFQDQTSYGIIVNAVKTSLLLRRNRFYSHIINPVWVTSSAEVAVVNNYIESIGDDNTWTSTCLVVGNGANVLVAHNTMVVKTKAPSSVLNFFASKARIFNNIIANYGTGSAYSYAERNVDSDNNSFFVKNGPIATRLNDDGHTSHDLATWQAYTGEDQHSIVVDPELPINHEPRIHLKASNYKLDGAGKVLTEVIEDFDGDIRDTTHPDIGADEFTTPSVDVGITSTSLRTFSCNPQTQSVSVKNYSKTPVSSGSVAWSVNGTAKTSLVIGTLAANEEKSISLTGYTPQNNDALIFELKNIIGDGAPRNDSLKVQYRTRSGMNGPYTVGGATPNFLTMEAAFMALETSGVCGPVTFNVRPGTYNETFTIKSYVGVSEQNVVTLQPETNNNTSVTITGEITMSGASWTSIRSFTLQNAKIIIGTKSLHNNVLNNRLAFSEINTRGYNGFNTIADNVVTSTGGYYADGLSLYGENSTGNVVRNNVMPTNNVLISSQVSLLLENNVFSYLNLDDVHGKYLVRNNEIQKLYLQESVGFDQARGLIANNLLGELNVRQSDNVSILHNTIVAKEVSGIDLVVDVNTFALAGYDNYDNIEVRNNIIGTTVDRMLAGYGVKDGIVVDNNIYWGSHKTPFMLFDRTKVSQDGYAFRSYPAWEYSETLDKYHERTGLDANSKFFMPRFASNTDFHIVDDARVNGMGVPTEVKFDFDGIARDNDKPDPGAFELLFTPLPVDAGVVKVERPSPCGSVHNVNVSIRNFGSTTLTSCTVKWQLNGGTVHDTQWTGSLLPGAIAIVNAGSVALTPADTLGIKAWTVLPNGMTDQDVDNDTYFVEKIYQKLLGEYTVGTGSQYDFATPRDAGIYVGHVGACGPVKFLIAPGTYENMWVVDAKLTKETPVTFTSMSGNANSVTILGEDWEYENHWMLRSFAVFIRNSEHIKVSNIGIEAKYDVNGILIDNSSNIDITNNVLVWLKPFNNSITSLLSIGGGTVKNITVEKNHFIEAYRAVSVGFNATAVVDNIVIRENHFDEQRERALYIAYGANIFVENNLVTSTARVSNLGPAEWPTIPTNAIYVSSVKDSVRISNNTIKGSFNSAIYLGWANSSSYVYNNVITGDEYMQSGFFSYYSEGSTFAFNTVKMKGNQYSHCMGSEHHVYPSLKVINNNFTTSAGQLSRFSDVWNVDEFIIDYNSYYSPAPKFTWDETTYTSFDSYLTASKVDKHSVFENPFFVSDTDLRPTNPMLSAGGISIPGITHDVAGTIRNTPPDIGAYEFTAAPVDLAVSSLTTDLCVAQPIVYVSLKNTGTVTIVKTTLKWSVNGINQTPLQWRGSLLPNQTIDNFALGSFQVVPGPVNLQVEGRDSNGAADGQPSNNVVSVSKQTFAKVDLGADKAICNSAADSFVIVPNLAFSGYSWSTASTASTLEVFDTGTYTVTTTDANGCISSDGIRVTFNEIDKAIFGNDISVCPESFPVTIQPVNAFTSYTWSNGQTGATVLASQGGEYRLTVKDGNGCEGSDTLTVAVTTVRPPVILNNDDHLEVDAEYDDYQWFEKTTSIPGAKFQTMEIEESGEYHVVVKQDGCSATSNVLSVTITITGLGDSDMDYKVYPNPTHDLLFIDIPSEAESVRIELVSSSGVIQLLPATVQGETMMLNLAGLARGAYILRINAGSKFETFKVVVD